MLAFVLPPRNEAQENESWAMCWLDSLSLCCKLLFLSGQTSPLWCSTVNLCPAPTRDFLLLPNLYLAAVPGNYHHLQKLRPALINECVNQWIFPFTMTTKIVTFCYAYHLTQWSHENFLVTTCHYFFHVVSGAKRETSHLSKWHFARCLRLEPEATSRSADVAAYGHQLVFAPK